MVDCATVPSNFKLQWKRSNTKGVWLQPRKSLSAHFPRNSKYASLSLCSVHKNNTLLVSTYNCTRPVSIGSSFRCSYFGTMIDFEPSDASDWVPAIDQMLLSVSVFLTYIAGVVPSRRTSVNTQKISSKDILLPGNSFFGTEDETSCPCTWDVLKGKIRNSLLVGENGDIKENDFVQFDQDRIRGPLSLYAIAHGPRFRLLLSSVEQLEKEISEIPDTSEAMEREAWVGLFARMVKKACESAFLSWMEKEFCTEDCSPDKELLIAMSEKLKGDDVIFGNIRRSGKMDLYADLTGYLRYGLFREYSYYDPKIYSVLGGPILDDLIITVADTVASMYLELVSVDSDVAEKISNLGLSLCTLSTRALQKLRNEVAMCQWIHQNFQEIVLMYEDRFDLRVLKNEPYEPVQKSKEDIKWWRRLGQRKSVTTHSSQCYAVISHFPLTLKRTRELRALRGWRYYFSLLLEFSDIAMPMAKAVITQIRNAISFFLVSLLGRSVGLVYTGIRQSLGWK